MLRGLPESPPRVPKLGANNPVEQICQELIRKLLDAYVKIQNCNVLIDPRVGFLTFLNGKHFNIDPHEFAGKSSVYQSSPASCSDNLVFITLTRIFGKTDWLDCVTECNWLCQGENLWMIVKLRILMLIIWRYRRVWGSINLTEAAAVIPGWMEINLGHSGDNCRIRSIMSS